MIPEIHIYKEALVNTARRMVSTQTPDHDYHQTAENVQRILEDDALMHDEAMDDRVVRLLEKNFFIAFRSYVERMMLGADVNPPFEHSDELSVFFTRMLVNMKI